MKKVLFYFSLLIISLVFIFAQSDIASADCGEVAVGSCDGGACIQGTAACTCDEVASPTCLFEVSTCIANCKNPTECDACGSQADCPIVPMNIICPSRGCTSDCGCGCVTEKACTVAYCDKPGVEWFCIKETQYIPIIDTCPDKQCIGPADCGGGGGGGDDCIPNCRDKKCGVQDAKCGELCGSAFDTGCSTLSAICVDKTSATATVIVPSNIIPVRYNWYKLNATGSQWINVYTEECQRGICKKSYTYALPENKATLSFSVEGSVGGDSRVFTGQSNSLLIDCNNVCVNGAIKNCTNSSNCPGQQICANSTWGTCTDIPNDGCPTGGGCVNGSSQGCVTIDNCPGNQTCVNNVWNSCIDVPNDNCPAVSVCTIDSASVTPAPPKIIYLGGKFKVTWQTSNCSTCTITCNTLDKCGVNGLVQPVGDSGEIEVKPTSSGYYAYKITCDGGAGGASSIVLPSTDVWDGVSPTLKTNVGAYRVRRPFIFETPAFLKLLIDKLF
ncbi:MAG: hypothetical protein WAW33_02565 [Minisyncoccia bacterium]